MRNRFAAAAFLLLAAAVPARAADPDALWKVVSGMCVPNQQQHGNPAPCAVVDLAGGAARGYVLLKDIRGKTQYLLIPTAKVTGIEDPALLRPDGPNYFAAAWRERGYTERAVGHALPRDALSLAVNSPYARSQNQLHIHIDCLRADIRAELRRLLPAISDRWRPLAVWLAGHRYWARRVVAADLDGADPFQLLAAEKLGARAAMRRHTLVVAGMTFTDGRPGFVLLDDQVNFAAGDRAGGEELQDHTCAVAQAEGGR